METNAQRLLADVKAQLAQYNIPNAEKYEANVVAFLNQCTDDVILEDAKVVWDNEKEFDFLWDTAHLDCRFSIGLEDTSWQLWVGVNNHSKDDECYVHGVGGEEIDDRNIFASIFFDEMEWHIITNDTKQIE